MHVYCLTACPCFLNKLLLTLFCVELISLPKLALEGFELFDHSVKRGIFGYSEDSGGIVRVVGVQLGYSEGTVGVQ